MTTRGSQHYWGTALFGVVLALAAPALAQDARMVPTAAPADPTAIPLGTGGVAGSQAPEAWFRQYGVAMTRNVSTATLTPFLPDPAEANGLAVIVAPGGGFLMLSMENEGWRLARAPADRGIAAFVLEYRLKPTPAGMPQFEQAVAAMFAGACRADSRLRPDDAAKGMAEPIADERAAFALIRARARMACRSGTGRDDRLFGRRDDDDGDRACCTRTAPGIPRADLRIDGGGYRPPRRTATVRRARRRRPAPRA